MEDEMTLDEINKFLNDWENRHQPGILGVIKKRRVFSMLELDTEGTLKDGTNNSTHASDNDPNISLTCDFCQTLCKNIDHLKDHVYRHFDITAPPKVFQCNVCSKTLTSEATYQLHLNTHPPTNPTCDFCLESFDNEKELKRHLPIHGQVAKTVKCKQCGDQFLTEKDLKLHMKAHDAKSFICDHCRIKCSSRRALIRHLKVHFEPLTCGYCGKKFPDITGLRVHIRVHTGEKLFKCEECDQDFATNHRLRRHLDRVHLNRPFKCPTCYKEFRGKYPYDCHLKVHKLWFTCDYCKKGFARKYQLFLHIGVHTGVRPFQCPYCQKCFHRKGVLTVHMRMHTGDKPYVCKMCDKSFMYSNSYLYHVRIHTQEFRFVCDKCPLKFRYRKRLLNHKKREHPETYPLLSCSYCTYTSDKSVSLRRHLIIQHRKISNLLG